ncbi:MULTISPECIES: Lrp/AsnC family transcriptional regulator [Spirosoma]|uniref:Transcriptional regulator, AsnC family n=1 Tax=Spirosoma linguale (strain ATCC 33905 / DSM 74 / LMG 10896 / Claus 1) TaxID=504472 RepID=D2QK88_SPILD|nr:Lrp/AsnC family transcriptional regulator [Spirosoma sp.]ADB38914.1 transcriptional regulator, AsnC family [Spirosoma linguale DSM 74]MCX6215506.1 Lrp/AsnC family transcriptional regulator [Spirosoma sp.]
MENLDNTDRKILTLLQQNARLTIQEIGQRINLSKTPVHERIKRLEREGIIERYVTILNKKKLGNLLMVYCQVTLDRQTRDAFADFEGAIRLLPDVLECNRVSGTFDYLLKIVSRDMETYNYFYQEQLSVIPGTLHISSFFVMADVKSSTIVPLE